MLAEGIAIKDKHEQQKLSNPAQSQVVNRRNVRFSRVINKGFRDFFILANKHELSIEQIVSCKTKNISVK